MEAITVIPDLFSPEAYDALRYYVVNSLRHDGEPDEVFQRTARHNPRPLVWIHDQLVSLASDLFGQPVKASYCFSSNYLDGGKCPLHVDRPQCWRTIDYLVTQDSPDPWTIRIGEPWTDDQFTTEGGERFRDLVPEGTDPDLDVRWHDIDLTPNSAVAYSGTHSWHYRPKPSVGRADLIFFHFVPEDFDGPLN